MSARQTVCELDWTQGLLRSVLDARSVTNSFVSSFKTIELAVCWWCWKTNPRNSLLSQMSYNAVYNTKAVHALPSIINLFSSSALSQTEQNLTEIVCQQKRWPRASELLEVKRAIDDSKAPFRPEVDCAPRSSLFSFAVAAWKALSFRSSPVLIFAPVIAASVDPQAQLMRYLSLTRIAWSRVQLQYAGWVVGLSRLNSRVPSESGNVAKKFGHFTAWRSVGKKIFGAVLEWKKRNSFPDLIFWHAFW